MIIASTTSYASTVKPETKTRDGTRESSHEFVSDSNSFKVRDYSPHSLCESAARSRRTPAYQRYNIEYSLRVL